jgi:hypothetical protein
MDKFKLTPYEKRIEQELMRGEWVPADPEETKLIIEALKRRRKDAVLNIRVNSEDQEGSKSKPRSLASNTRPTFRK